MGYYVVAWANAAADKPKMDRRCTGGHGKNFLVSSQKLFQVLFETIYIRPERGDPIVIKRFSDIVQFLPAEMGKRKMDSSLLYASVVHLYSIVKLL